VHDIVHKWNREHGFHKHTYKISKWSANEFKTLISSLLVWLPLWHQWAKRLFISLACHSPFAFHHFLFHPYHLHLITSYFTPPLASMDKEITHYHLVEWHLKSLSLVCMEPNSSISSWSKKVLSISTYFSMILDLSTMIMKYDPFLADPRKFYPYPRKFYPYPTYFSMNH
jgi:hypothetical protein